MKLRPIKFDWKNKNNDKKSIGLIAQDLLNIIPEVVVEPKNKEELLGVKYADLIPVLIKAIQEQQNQITALVQKNNTLSSQISEIINLKAEVIALKNQ